MADYGGKGAVIALPLIVGVLVGVGINELLGIHGGKGALAIIFFSIVITFILFKTILGWTFRMDKRRRSGRYR